MEGLQVKQKMILKYRAVPAKKDPSHDSELQTVSETASNVCFVFIRLSSARHSLALPKARFQELAIFSERIVNLSFYFIDMIKLKKIGKYEGCSTSLYYRCSRLT